MHNEPGDAWPVWAVLQSLWCLSHAKDAVQPSSTRHRWPCSENGVGIGTTTLTSRLSAMMRCSSMSNDREHLLMQNSVKAHTTKDKTGREADLGLLSALGSVSGVSIHYSQCVSRATSTQLLAAIIYMCCMDCVADLVMISTANTHMCNLAFQGVRLA